MKQNAGTVILIIYAGADRLNSYCYFPVILYNNIIFTMSELVDNLKQPELNQFQEELAKTYFASFPSKKDNTVRPVISQKNKKTPIIVISLLLGLIAGLLLTIYTLSVLVIKIKTAPQAVETISLNQSGEMNRDVVKSALFYGNASSESSWGKSFVLITGEDPSKKSALGIDFTRPLNMAKYSLCFYARGEGGEGDFRVSFRDSKGNVCFSTIYLLQNPWQEFIVDLASAKNLIDIENITRLDIEINPLEKQWQGQGNFKTYFKDINLIKERGQ